MLSLRDDEVESLKTLAITQRSEWAARREEERQTVELSLGRTDERLMRLTDALLDDLLDQELFENRKRSLLLERKALRERLEGLTATHQSASAKLIEFLELAKRASLSYRSGNLY